MMIEELHRKIHFCRHPACFEEATWVVVAVTPQHVGDDADPTDAITSLSQVCDTHNKDPWIEVKRLARDGSHGKQFPTTRVKRA